MPTNIIAILLTMWMLLLVLQVFVHYILIEMKDEQPFYLVWGIIRGMVSIGHGILFDVKNMAEFAPILMFHVTTHFVFFSPALNLMRKKEFWYLGENSGWTDRVLKWSGIWVYQALYALGSILIPVSVWWILRVFGV
jgi:hypothetical protein